MYKSAMKPAPAPHPERVAFERVYEAIRKGYRVDPRYVDALLVSIEKKIEAADLLGRAVMAEEMIERKKIVEAYINRGTQAEILQEAQEQGRLAVAYADTGLRDLSQMAQMRHDELMTAWQRYHIRARL